MRFGHCWLGLVLALFVSQAQSAEKLEYNKHIRPILAENCFACHGPDSAARKAGLRLDQRELAEKAGAFVPGKPEKSALVKRTQATAADEVMPPPTSHKKLTPAQKETLQRWIAEGAEYQPHWSFLLPKKPSVPPVKNTKWVRNPLDAFVLTELEKRGLTPAPEADRRSWARRVSFDLVGLPPEPKDVDAFVADTSEKAYEKYVDQLLQSPHWGEHRGRHWLDAARYADTHGIHFDNFREMWAYRDWVINAFNKNQPFDKFTLDQIAGDLLPNRTLDQLVATGFSRCNITTNEGGVIAEEYVVLYARDRTETMAQVWLGLTAGCAVCHDHKFDPISMRDFYSLSAFFNNTTQNAMDGNIRDTPPIVPVPILDDRPKFEEIASKIAALQKELAARKIMTQPEHDTWLRSVKPESLTQYLPSEKLSFHAPLDEGKGNSIKLVVDKKEQTLTLKTDPVWGPGKFTAKGLTLQPDVDISLPDVGQFDTKQGFTIGAWVKIPKRGNTGALAARMDTAQNKHRGWDFWLENDRVGMHLVHNWPDSAVKVVAKTPLAPNQWTHVLVSYDGSSKAAGVRVYYNGVLQTVEVQSDKLDNTIVSKVPFRIGHREGDKQTNFALQDLRLYAQTLPGPAVTQLATTPSIQALLAKPADKRTQAEKTELHTWWFQTLDPQARSLTQKLAELQQEETMFRSKGTIAHVMQERSNSEASAYILFRGDYDKRRDKVTADTPKALPALAGDLPRNRLGLAHWLLSEENPLTTRVTVNRFWQELFGTGLVRTSGDFGISGELPSHPELLDWLAQDFRENGWDVKRFFKQLVLSATYRQAPIVTPEKLEKDRENRLLSRGPRYRMDAEMVRDNALAVSGLLVRKLGGPSVKPYQPEGVWEAVAMIGSNTRDYKRDTGEKLYRRSMYTFWKRSAPPAFLEIFNAPNRETCTVRRERTNTPLQALVTLNDVQHVEAAKLLAQKTLLEADKTTEARLDYLTKRLLARTFRAAESQIVLENYRDLKQYYSAHLDDAKKLLVVGETPVDDKLDPAELASWTMLANQLMNLDEVLNK